MIVLLISHHINALISMILFVLFDGQADVLGHIYRCAISPLYDLLIQSVGFQVDPYAAIVLAEEYAFFQTELHQVLAQQVSIALIIYLIEVTADALVCLVKAGIYPAVHGLP